MNSQFLTDESHLSPKSLEKKHRIENEPSFRKSIFEYEDGMENINSDISEKVLGALSEFNPEKYTESDVKRALSSEKCTVEDFKSLLSPAADNFTKETALRAKSETARRFGNSVYIFTPLYIANFCDNYCVYCGFNRYNNIRRMKLDFSQIEKEMELIAQNKIEEVLLLTGESHVKSDIEYIGKAVEISKKYFRSTGIEIYPVNTSEYHYLHECGADFVTVFQETYDLKRYEELHLDGKKRVWPYRFDAQERALLGGMRGVSFSALLGLSDFRKDAFASAMHLYFLQKKYPHAEMSLSCPRLRPIANNSKITSQGIDKKQLLRILCAYRIFLPYAGITVSSRESAKFRNGIVKIAATKVSAGVSTGVGERQNKRSCGDGQFEISDERSLGQIYADLENAGLQPVLNEEIYL